MAISLVKGQKISLSKEKAGLNKVIIGLGWDEIKPEKKGFLASIYSFFTTSNIDCDAFAIMLRNGILVEEDEDVIYFAHLSHDSGSVRHMGDNLTGAGDGDDEQIEINLSKVPKEYDRIVVGVNIFAATRRNQHFGMIKNCFIRVVDASNNQEICIYRVAENYDGKTALLFGELYNNNGEWKFNAIGEATCDKNIYEVANRFKH